MGHTSYRQSIGVQQRLSGTKTKNSNGDELRSARGFIMCCFCKHVGVEGLWDFNGSRWCIISATHCSWRGWQAQPQLRLVLGQLHQHKSGHCRRGRLNRQVTLRFKYLGGSWHLAWCFQHHCNQRFQVMIRYRLSSFRLTRFDYLRKYLGGGGSWQVQSLFVTRGCRFMTRHRQNSNCLTP